MYKRRASDSYARLKESIKSNRFPNPYKKEVYHKIETLRTGIEDMYI